MNLPYYAKYLIKEFSRPLTRCDWRTCKKKEADLVLEKVATDIYRMDAIKQILMTRNTHLKHHVDMAFGSASSWSHYGRHILLKHKDKMRQIAFTVRFHLNHYAYLHYFDALLNNYRNIGYEGAMRPFIW